MDDHPAIDARADDQLRGLIADLDEATEQLENCIFECVIARDERVSISLREAYWIVDVIQTVADFLHELRFGRSA
jgi:hypothetical protein